MTLSATWRGPLRIWETGSIRPPMVPTHEDISLMQKACAESLPVNHKTRVLVLGVTPAIVMAHWLEGCDIKAADYDKDMIDALWPADAGDHVEAICADWTELPFPDDHFDLVVGDGSFCALPSLDAYPAVLAEILRVKRRSAPINARFFMRPAEPLTFQDIVDVDGTLLLPNHDPTELRLLTAMAACDPDGAANYQQIAPKIQQQWGDLDRYIAAAWPDEQDAAKFRHITELTQRLNFPTLRQIVDQFAPFNLSATLFEPSYRLGAFCPTIRFDG